MSRGQLQNSPPKNLENSSPTRMIKKIIINIPTASSQQFLRPVSETSSSSTTMDPHLPAQGSISQNLTTPWKRSHQPNPSSTSYEEIQTFGLIQGWQLLGRSRSETQEQPLVSKASTVLCPGPSPAPRGLLTSKGAAFILLEAKLLFVAALPC